MIIFDFFIDCDIMKKYKITINTNISCDNILAFNKIVIIKKNYAINLKPIKNDIE